MKNKLTYYLRLVKKNAKVIVTDRGTPVALIEPANDIKDFSKGEEALAQLSRNGIISLPKKKLLRGVDKIKVEGIPISQTILQDRE